MRCAKVRLRGPFEISSIDETVPLSRRFGVKQSGKIRCVDDFSLFGINAASQPLESPKPHTLDVICSMMVEVMCRGPRLSPWVARSFDLKSAYRQCGVHPSSRQFSFIAVGQRRSRSLKACRLKALPVRQCEVGPQFSSSCAQHLGHSHLRFHGHHIQLLRRLRLHLLRCRVGIS